MKPWIRDILRLIESVGLGLWISVMLMALPGGVYEVITGSPSDGFLLMLFVYGLPLFAAALLMVPVVCWKNKKCLLIARGTSLFFLVTLVAIRSMQP